MATDALQRQRARRAALPHPETFVFLDTTGQPIRRSNFHRRVWAKVLEAAELDDLSLHFHDLRHVCASTLIAAGMDVVTVSALLGHASPATTLSIYSHALPSKMKSTADKVDELFGA